MRIVSTLTAPLPATDPLSLGQFWDDLRFSIGCPDPVLQESGVQNETAGGDLIAASWGARLWRFPVTLAGLPAEQYDRLVGRLDLLSDGVASFMAVPPFRAFPAFDPQGLFLASTAPVIASLPVGGRTLTISGLPGHFILTAGDFLSFTYGSPQRHALHRLVTGGRADAAGLSPELQVVPPLRPGAAVGAAVALRQPAMRACMVPGSLRRPPRSTATMVGIGFEVSQVLNKAT